MYKVNFTETAVESLKKIDKIISKRIIEKIFISLANCRCLKYLMSLFRFTDTVNSLQVIAL